MNRHLYVYVWTCVLMYLGYIPRRGIAGSYGNSMFHFLKTCQASPQPGILTLKSEVSVAGASRSWGRSVGWKAAVMPSPRLAWHLLCSQHVVHEAQPSGGHLLWHFPACVSPSLDCALLPRAGTLPAASQWSRPAPRRPTTHACHVGASRTDSNLKELVIF